MSKRCKLIHLCLITSALLVPAPTVSRSAEYSLEQIHSAWRKRHNAVKSARFEWIETETIPKGTLGREGPKIFPPEDTTLELQKRLVVDVGMLRTEWRGMQWDGAKKKFATQEYWAASDGKMSKSFSKTFVDPFSDQPYSLGYVHVESKNVDLIGGCPGSILLYALRPFDPDMGCTGKLQGLLTSTGPPKVVVKNANGQPQAVIEQAFGDRARAIWTDPQQDFAITFYVVTINGSESYKCEIKNIEDSIAGWIPQSWQSQNWQHGSNGAVRLWSARAAEITHYEINPKIEVGEFNPQFPPGTVVSDRRNKTEYLVKEDNAKREILPSERDRKASYAEITSTDTGKAGLYRASSSALYSLLAAIGVIVIALCVFWIRRH